MVRFNVNSMNYGSLFGYGSRVNNQKSLYSSLSRLSNKRTAKATLNYNANVLKTRGKTSSLNFDTKGTSKLLSATDKLTNIEKNNLFANKKTYDADQAYKMASDFVNNYNDTVKYLNDEGSVSIKSAGSSMTKMTDIMKNSLKRAGISVGSDGMLSIDEETFKKADMNTVKNLFGNTSSYARVISSSAQRVQDAVYRQQSYNTQSMYGKSGMYYNNLLSGYGFNSLF
ncbi:MAG: hypothetical protein IJT72_02265 [Lachnospiraceae bacterium]|nr:hypothetical protein [Lachnospiraceae bacterium]